MSAFMPGDFLPWFKVESSVNPSFAFDTLAGHRFLLVFLGTARSAHGRAVAEAVSAESEWLSRNRILVYLVSADPRDREDGYLTDLPSGSTVFWDFDRSVHRRFGMAATAPDAPGSPVLLRTGIFLVRENLRLHAVIQSDRADGLMARTRAAAATLPAIEPARPATAHAPILLIPDLIDRADCRRLIDYYERVGGTESGFMRDIAGQTHGILDANTKRRKDCHIEDEALLAPIRRALQCKVVPEIAKAFGHRLTRVERYLLACYDASDRGFFRAHRDNTAKATAHRKFAVSLNLNAEDYEGGTLRFPEYSPHLYKPETGGAVVFSCSVLHEALPVTRGRRYVVLPFLYGDRDAVTRAEGQRFLHRDPPGPADRAGGVGQTGGIDQTGAPGAAAG